MMYTVKMNPVNRMPRAHRLPMPGMFSDPFFRSMMSPEPQHRPMGMRVDVREVQDAYILEAELPGVALEDITLTTENDVLTIGADVNRHNKEERDGFVIRERCSGHVERRFSLEGIDQEGIAANCLNGVLTVTLPKMKLEDGKALRHIAIGAGELPKAAALPESVCEEASAEA